MTMLTKAQQQTERALIEAERAWLKARGWRCITTWAGDRWQHDALDSQHDLLETTLAIVATRAEPLRFMARAS